MSECPHESASFDRSLCACGWMHDYCDDCGAAIGCELDEHPEDGTEPVGIWVTEATLARALARLPGWAEPPRHEVHAAAIMAALLEDER